MSKSLKLTMFGCLFLFCCVIASAQDIRFNYKRGTDFSNYRTYKWVQVPNVRYPNQIIDGQIKDAIDAQLALKGLQKTEQDPDLYVTYQAAVNQQTQWNSYST